MPTLGYSGKPLAQKLGLTADMRLLVRHAPPDWDEIIGTLPADVTLATSLRGSLDLAIIFVTAAAKLTLEFPRVAPLIAEKRALWVAWPKKSAGVQTDLSENLVRDIGIAVGWVDVKVCAISTVWSGLQFRRRRK